MELRMRFELHKSIRYNDSSTPADYFKAEIEYLAHLQKIDFSRAKSVLKYMGYSFFHNSYIQSVSINRDSHKIILKIFRADDLEDLNNYRCSLKLKPISTNEYHRRPLLYECVFESVEYADISQAILDFDSQIIDTEVDFDKKSKLFVVAFSLGEDSEILLKFSTFKVKIINQHRVAELLNDEKVIMPYCLQCKEKLLTKNQIDKNIKNFKKQLLQL